MIVCSICLRGMFVRGRAYARWMRKTAGIAAQVRFLLFRCLCGWPQSFLQSTIAETCIECAWAVCTFRWNVCVGDRRRMGTKANKIACRIYKNRTAPSASLDGKRWFDERSIPSPICARLRIATWAHSHLWDAFFCAVYASVDAWIIANKKSFLQSPYPHRSIDDNLLLLLLFFWPMHRRTILKFQTTISLSLCATNLCKLQAMWTLQSIFDID